MRKTIALLLFVFGSEMSMSCSDEYTQEAVQYEFSVALYAENSKRHQSAASYGDYVFFVTNLRSHLYLYNLKKKMLLCDKKFVPVTEKTGNYILYHCNQMTFGNRRYAEQDPFPLLYISQRARSDKRCIIEVYRIIPEKSGSDDYTAMDAILVQTIYFPVMSAENALGRVNVAIDNDSGDMYCYSYSTLSSDLNYGQCRSSKLTIPDIYEKEVYMEDKDIIDSFSLDYSGINSQGGCIKDGKLYIGQGYPGAGYVYLNIIDLRKKMLLERVDLLSMGVTWEPQGCFFYDRNLMFGETENIWELRLVQKYE